MIFNCADFFDPEDDIFQKAFAKNALNIIDLVSILPYYVELMVPKARLFAHFLLEQYLMKSRTNLK